MFRQIGAMKDPLRSGRADQKPSGWGGTNLTAFMEEAYKNRWATFVRKREAFQKLDGIDKCFDTGLSKWTDPTHPISALLFFRSHAAFRAACEHALAGQCSEFYPLARACLEYSAYALHMALTPGLEEVWLKRHDGEAELKEVRANFHNGAVLASIRTRNRHAADVFGELYQQCIDLGAHPNERGVTGSLEIVDREDGGKEFLQIYLHGDGVRLDHTLLVAARVGISALEVVQETFPERFELLGVRHAILNLRSGL